MQAKFHMNAKNIQLLNGNIDTRIKKLNNGMYDCIILAEAGLSRLSSLLEKQNYKQLEHITCSGQGVLAVQWKEGSKVGDFIKSSLLFDQMKELNEQIKMERNLLKKLNGIFQNFLLINQAMLSKDMAAWMLPNQSKLILPNF